MDQDQSKKLVDKTESNHRIYDFLKSKHDGVLATVDPNGNPHATAIYFVPQDDFSVLFTTKRDTKKYDNIQHNNHVMFLVYDSYSQTTVQIEGIAELVEDTAESQAAFDSMLESAMMKSEAGTPPISKLYAGYYVAYKIKPVQIRMAMFVRPDPGGYDIFETVDFVA